jgi:hypothetical protein
LRLTVHDAWVKGGPSNMTVIMRWSAVQDLQDGSPYNNHATRHAAFIQLRRFRPLGRLFFEATLRLLSLRPDDLLTILTMALSIDSRDSVSLFPSIQATRF